MRSLEGKRALVTGGTAGIGRAIALRFAREGAHVVVVGTHAERAEAAVCALRAEGVPSQHFSSLLVDVSDKRAVDIALQSLLKDWGAVDILVNCAGIVRDNLLMKMEEEEWDQVIQVNLKSLYNICRLLVRPMLKARSGAIINISSVIGLVGNAGQTNYAAAKAGMIGFTKAFALEVASRNVRVNCIAPGFIETAMTDQLSAQQRAAILQKIPLGRMGAPEEIAEAALFLASAHYMTGQVVVVDGGMVM